MTFTKQTDPVPFLIKGNLSRAGPLYAEGCDEDVHYNDDEDEGCGNILQDVQLVVRAFIINIPLHCKE